MMVLFHIFGSQLIHTSLIDSRKCIEKIMNWFSKIACQSLMPVNLNLNLIEIWFNENFVYCNSALIIITILIILKHNELNVNITDIFRTLFTNWNSIVEHFTAIGIRIFSFAFKCKQHCLLENANWVLIYEVKYFSLEQQN